jgi:hypothetical protein
MSSVVSLQEPAWKKSRRCVGEAHCVEVFVGVDRVLVRNSLFPESVLTLTSSEWRAFVEDLQDSYDSGGPTDEH